MGRKHGRAGPAVLAACAVAVLAGCGGGTGAPGHRPAPTTNPRTSTSVATTTAPPPSATVAPVDTSIDVYADCTRASVEPTEIVLTCADLGQVLQGLHWTTWSSSGAIGTGTLVYNDCEPDCANGSHHRVPDTTVVLSTPVHSAGGGLVYSEVQISPPPPGSATAPYPDGPRPLPTQPT